jgi:hypothetical protein
MYNSIMRARAVLAHIATIIVSVTLSAVAATAWTGPTSSPPDGNADAPINVGATTQFKNGNLGLWGNILLAASGGSYLNFGATSGVDGYGIRDNNGTLEFKSTGGSWNNLTNTVTNVLGIGAVTQIKFADGTTQTTAASSASRTYVVFDGTDGSIIEGNGIASVTRNSTGKYTVTLSTPRASNTYPVLTGQMTSLTSSSLRGARIVTGTKTTTSFDVWYSSVSAGPSSGFFDPDEAYVYLP